MTTNPGTAIKVNGKLNVNKNGTKVLFTTGKPKDSDGPTVVGLGRRKIVAAGSFLLAETPLATRSIPVCSRDQFQCRSTQGNRQ